MDIRGRQVEREIGTKTPLTRSGLFRNPLPLNHTWLNANVIASLRAPGNLQLSNSELTIPSLELATLFSANPCLLWLIEMTQGDALERYMRVGNWALPLKRPTWPNKNPTKLSFTTCPCNVERNVKCNFTYATTKSNCQTVIGGVCDTAFTRCIPITQQTYFKVWGTT